MQQKKKKSPKYFIYYRGTLDIPNCAFENNLIYSVRYLHSWVNKKHEYKSMPAQNFYTCSQQYRTVRVC